MCSDTSGARPVNSLTLAASAIFSATVRGVPGLPNTLNRVPELPYAQDGTSIACPSSCALIALKVVISHLLHGLVGLCVVRSRRDWRAGPPGGRPPPAREILGLAADRRGPRRTRPSRPA